MAVCSVVLLLALSAPPAEGQNLRVGGEMEDYLRLMQITGRVAPGSFSIRPLVDEASSGLEGVPNRWARALADTRDSTDAAEESGVRTPWQVEAGWTGSRARVFANSGHPWGGNDGAVWQGKGVTAALEVGGWARWGWLSLRAQPVATIAQNLDFDLAPVVPWRSPPYGYPWRTIDLPQRFGDEAVTLLHPGDSELRVKIRGVTFGLSSRNLWWGPGIHHSVMMTNNAPGIVHGFVGTRRPVDVWIGEVEAQWIWGRLEQSDYFDPDVDATDRFLTGAVFTFRPSFAEGLYVGGTRVFFGFVPEGGPEVGDFLLVFQGVRKEQLVTPENPSGDDRRDQLFSMFLRWVFPESGLELYGEWGRNDHAWNFRDFFLEPEHAQGYVLGLRKASSFAGDRTVTVGVELVNLQRGRTGELRAIPTFYGHHIVLQGYTHRGQIIGSSLGPGGSGQILTVELHDHGSRARLKLQRRVHDNDAYYSYATSQGLDSCCHHVGLSAGLDALWLAGDGFDLGGSFTLTRELNRYFDRGNDVWNLNLSLSMRWRPR